MSLASVRRVCGFILFALSRHRSTSADQPDAAVTHDTTSRRPAADRPMLRKRCSPAEWSGSGITSSSGSPNTVMGPRKCDGVLREVLLGLCRIPLELHSLVSTPTPCQPCSSGPTRRSTPCHGYRRPRNSTPRVLKACIPARAALAELNAAAHLIPTPAILINTIPVLEARQLRDREHRHYTDRLSRRAADETAWTPAFDACPRQHCATRRPGSSSTHTAGGGGAAAGAAGELGALPVYNPAR